MTRAAGRSLLGISTPLASTYDVALLDLDGVVYVGPDPIPSAAPALAKARAAGIFVVMDRCILVEHRARFR